MTAPGAGPLTGIRVVELGGIGPGPFAAMMLADLGAEVVRVYRPADVDAAPNPVLDRGRRSLAVDLRAPEGRALVRRLVDRADALVEGFRPGVAERLGFAPDELLAARPQLVIGRMTGYGQTGPLAQRAGHDINYISLSGALAAIGRPGTPPVPPLNLVGDFGGGGMVLAMGILAALLNARTTGRGQVVDAAMVEGSAALMAMTYGFLAQGRWTADRGTNLLDSGAPFYDVYPCRDGGFMAVGAIEPAFFAALVEGLGVAAEIDLARQHDRSTWPHQRAVFTRAFGSATRAEWTERLEHLDACTTPVLDLVEAPAHPHNAARGAFVTAPDGAVHPRPVPRFSGTPSATPESAAAAGAHTDELLGELGCTAADIARLRTEGVVR
ncbi:CaiB/BaiF CoA transferase family protein [Blastococcus sp. SYSU DS0539]